MADVIVRGMEMPKDCPFCPMAHWNKFDALTGCNVVPGKKFVPETESEYWYSDHRPSWCPLLPLPEGHGKIIDGDALWENMTVEQSEAFQKGLAGTIELFEMLEAATPIVPAEGGDN